MPQQISSLWGSNDLMSTYVISDIHGAYDEFHRLLEKIGLRFDGSDSLYLLGDFGDWGARSMETILFVKGLEERYEFVHCLMGNHEMMFLSAIEGGIRGDEASEAAVNWLVNNRGLVTWNAYTSLPKEEQENLHCWLCALPFSYDVSVNGHLMMLAHAYPYFYDREYATEEALRRRMDAVWRRLMLHEDPFASYAGPKQYELLICGHTITDFYEQELQQERERSVVDSVVCSVAQAVPGGRNRIFHGDHFIDIDCGAKCMSLSETSDDGLLQSMKRALLERSQLAAYCLETRQEFYVSRPQNVVGEVIEGRSAPGLPIPQPGTSSGSDGKWRALSLQRTQRECPQVSAPEIVIPDPPLPQLANAFKAWTGKEAAR